ncbi:hypothetical protein K8Q93_01905 [Candidatus Parcubacteria bacterium]|nr:hypothetical protein [Candidatus Parcubacteria bacterium]
MKKLLVSGVLVIGLLFLNIPVSAEAAVWVDGYYKSNGTYVSGYYRSEPNGLKYDNYSWTEGDDLYNDSYYDTSYDSYWYTPSYTWDSDYYTGYNYNNYYLDSDFSNPYADSWYSDSYSDSYDWYDSSYDWY